jgi:protein SCO1
MDGLYKTFAASLLALLLGMGGIFAATDKGHAFTTETLRRSQVNRAPRQIPDLPVMDAEGREANLHPFLAADRRVWIVDFVYTRCQSVCSVLGSVYQHLQQQILARGLQNQVGLLSISFDPARDDASSLGDYAQRMHIDPATWKLVTLTHWQDRRRLLDAFGIMVIPAPLGEFEHNAALHIVDGQGQLVRILDYDAPDRALDAAILVAQSPK